MISLEKNSGLPIEMRDNYSLVFGKGLAEVEPEVLEFSDMRNYFKDPFGTFPRREVAYLYRGLLFPQHRKKLKAAKFEFVITVIPPGTVGDEFVKTRGHYQPPKPGTSVGYPGLAEVIYGKVFWILQSASTDFERLEEVYLISATRGEKVVVPSGYGQVSINPTEEVLVLGNWTQVGVSGIHEPYEVHNGAAYYVIKSERLSRSGTTSQDYEFLPNLSYKKVPKLLQAESRDLPQYDLRTALPMYFTATRNLDTLDFLVNPEKYLDELVPEKLFNLRNSGRI